jgi:hypothetical protein
VPISGEFAIAGRRSQRGDVLLWRRRYVKLRSRLGSLAHAQVELVELSGVIGDVGLGCRSSLQTSIRPGKDEPHRRMPCCVSDRHKGEAVGPHNPSAAGSNPARPTNPAFIRSVGPFALMISARWCAQRFTDEYSAGRCVRCRGCPGQSDGGESVAANGLSLWPRCSG